MLSKIVNIDGREVELRASASIPRIYRIRFRRDILQDLTKLKKAFVANQVEGQEFEILDLELFENVAYVMAKHADPTIPNDIGDWLDQYNMFSIYEIMPIILELWCLNEESQVESKKKLNQVAAER